MAQEYDIPKPIELMQTAHYSPYLNIYAYPEELDYLSIRPLPPAFCRFPHFIRQAEKGEVGEKSYSLPGKFLPDSTTTNEGSKLVYVSMGSMGSVCQTLMSRLVEMLSTSPLHRFIFSLGPSFEAIGPTLPANIWGAKFVPQMAILPLVDLVITHGGNNTLLETLYFGKPMIVCPLFAEQPEVKCLGLKSVKLNFYFYFIFVKIERPTSNRARSRAANQCIHLHSGGVASSN